MKLHDVDGYEIHLPTSGGKAGKGHNLTSTIQIRQGGLIIKAIRFVVADKLGRANAVQKAVDWIRKQRR